jgi:hypothetical protein
MAEGKEYSDLAKKYLLQIEELDKLIDRKQTERDYLYSRCFKTTTTLKQDIVSSSNANKSNLEATLVKVDAFDSEINEDIDALVDLRLNATRLLLALNNQDYYDVLRLKYFEYEIYTNFEMIADQMHCDYRTATRKHGEALIAFGKLLKESKKEIETI